MKGSEAEETTSRGEVLGHLRHGIRQSTRLAEQLAVNPIVGREALGLLGRLEAIRAELDALAVAGPDPRRAQSDPFWNKPPHPFRRNGLY